MGRRPRAPHGALIATTAGFLAWVVFIQQQNDLRGLAVTAGGVAILVTLLAHAGLWASVPLLLIAVALGWVLLRGEFGYTAWVRSFLAHGEGTGLAVGLIVPAVAALIIVPMSVLVAGYSGYVAPVGLSLIIGAALFGFGMQLGNGCGSGALYTFGGGSRRMWVVLPFFCLGGVLGSLLAPAALRLPSFPAVALADWLGPWGGLVITLALTLALIGMLLRRGPPPGALRLGAAIAIGGLAALTFLLSGQPWGITMGLTLWGAKAVSALGMDLTGTEFWSVDWAREALAGSLLDHDSSLMDMGIILGAAAAARRNGGVHFTPWPPARALLAAALGGLLMGIGARLAFGCNIGAMVGGISSGSLHGFVWLAAALPGSWLGMKLRPRFGLD